MEQYKSVKSFDTLLKLNIDFINGVINWTPYHQKPIENTGPMKESLIEVNQSGFLTLGGQCAEDTPTQEKKLFLDGYLHPESIRNFIKFLKGYKKIEYFIEFPNKEIKTNIRDWKNQYNIKENQSIYFNSLARVKKGDEWINTDILPFRDISYITLNFWKPFDNILNILKDYCFVHIQHRSFHNNANDLYPLIINYFKQSHFKPKKVKVNHFGTNKLKELKSDLRFCSFGQTKVSFGETKVSFLKRTKKHILSNKLNYANWIAKLAAAAAIKNYYNKKSKRKLEKKTNIQNENINSRLLNIEKLIKENNNSSNFKTFKEKKV